jgi:hypothetical protein
MTYRGRVSSGVVVLEGGVKLPEGLAVSVEPIEAKPATDADGIYGLADLAEPTGVPDLARNIDHYLYGHPKVKNGER